MIPARTVRSWVTAGLLCAGCGDVDRGPSSENEHNFGLLCMGGCHWPGSEKLTLGGSVRVSGGGEATVVLYTRPQGQGQIVQEIPVGEWGNFSSEEPIEWGEGLYVSIMGATDTKYMPEAVTDGECNGCHDGKTMPYLSIE